jgi:hypothetical protein
MATSTELERAARVLSEDLGDEEEAVEELLRLTQGHRVSLVMARQHLRESSDDSGDDQVSRALGLIETALERGAWA